MNNWDLNAASDFLDGFLTEQERQKNQKKIDKVVNSGQYDVQTEFDRNTGSMKYVLKPKNPLEQEIERGKLADAQLKQYQAGGPPP